MVDMITTSDRSFGSRDTLLLWITKFSFSIPWVPGAGSRVPRNPGPREPRARVEYRTDGLFSWGWGQKIMSYAKWKLTVSSANLLGDFSFLSIRADFKLPLAFN